MAQVKNKAEVEEDETEDTGSDSLVGSATPMVEVRAHVSVLGLAAGQTKTIVDTPEVRANARVGNLSILNSIDS